MAKRIKSGKSARLFIIGHDQVKTVVLELLSAESLDDEGRPNPHVLRVSDDLPLDWFDQVTGEVRRVRYVRNRPIMSSCQRNADNASRRRTRSVTPGLGGAPGAGGEGH